MPFLLLLFFFFKLYNKFVVYINCLYLSCKKKRELFTCFLTRENYFTFIAPVGSDRRGIVALRDNESRFQILFILQYSHDDLRSLNSTL